MLKPIFSALAIASSVVPVLLQSSLNLINFGSLINCLLKEWSADKATNVAPKIVSGRVVNTLIDSSQLTILKFNPSSAYAILNRKPL